MANQRAATPPIGMASDPGHVPRPNRRQPREKEGYEARKEASARHMRFWHSGEAVEAARRAQATPHNRTFQPENPLQKLLTLDPPLGSGEPLMPT